MKTLKSLAMLTGFVAMWPLSVLALAGLVLIYPLLAALDSMRLLPRRAHEWMDAGDEDADAAYSGRFPGH